MASSSSPHPEERAQGASRRTHVPQSNTGRNVPSRTITGLLIAAALLLVSCAPETDTYPAARKPTGVREALRTGHWRGPVGQTEVDFTIDQVAERK